MIRHHNRNWYFLKKSVLVFPYDPGGAQPFVAANALHGFYRQKWATAGALRRFWWRALRLGFLIWLPWRARKLSRFHGLPDERAKAVEALCRRRFMDPRDVIVNGFERDEDAETYARRFEEAAINRLLNPQFWNGTCVMDDKFAFARRCEERGLPTPPIRAFCVDGAITVNAPPGTAEVFVKPLHGVNGEGAGVFDMSGAKDHASFAARLAATAGKGDDWIAQDRLRTHPDLADVSLNALSTVRVYTLLNEQGACEIVSFSLKFTTNPDSVVDNAAQGGIHVGLDHATGQLGVGTGRALSAMYQANPANGARFTGRQMPLWREILDLARQAHEVGFPDYVYCGWDIAPTSEGVFLIEGNAKASMVNAQRANLRVMGPERWSELIGYHLDRALSDDKL